MRITNRLRSLTTVPLLLIALALSGPAIADENGEGFRVSQTCAGCHGTAGAAPGNTIPILGGQGSAYLANSLKAYKTGERDSYVMNFIAKAFSDDQIEEIAQWFSAQPWVPTGTESDPERARTAAPLAQETCSLCHGDQGEGTDIAPRLAGQPATYLTLALQAYKSGARTGKENKAMTVISDVADSDVEALAHYFSGLR